MPHFQRPRLVAERSQTPGKMSYQPSLSPDSPTQSTLSLTHWLLYATDSPLRSFISPGHDQLSAEFATCSGFEVGRVSPITFRFQQRAYATNPMARLHFLTRPRTRKYFCGENRRQGGKNESKIEWALSERGLPSALMVLLNLRRLRREASNNFNFGARCTVINFGAEHTAEVHFCSAW
jgi:hypothetical protein